MRLKNKFITWVFSQFKKHFFSLLKFGIVGTVTAGIFFLIMWFFQSALHARYTVAISFAYVISTVFHFTASKYFTFQNKQKMHHAQILRYLSVWVLNYLITLAVVSLCVEKLRFSSYIGVCCSIATTMCSGYFLSRYWVFKIKGEHA